jgi:hypothetical protein
MARASSTPARTLPLAKTFHGRRSSSAKPIVNLADPTGSAAGIRSGRSNAQQFFKKYRPSQSSAVNPDLLLEA